MLQMTKSGKRYGQKCGGSWQESTYSRVIQKLKKHLSENVLSIDVIRGNLRIRYGKHVWPIVVRIASQGYSSCLSLLASMEIEYCWILILVPEKNESCS